MKGAKLYKVEVWHYHDDSDDNPQMSWGSGPLARTTIPDCENAEINYKWKSEKDKGPIPASMAVYGTIKTYDHQLGQYLISRYPSQEHPVIGDCLLLYYRTDDGQEWVHRFNGVYFGRRTMKINSIEEVDTGKAELNLLTWKLARFHNGNETSYWSNWSNRVTLTQA